MLKRHQDERELLLSHLQDESTEDLIDAAKTMKDEDRQKRLSELQGKWLNLNFSNPGKQIYYTFDPQTKIVSFFKHWHFCYLCGLGLNRQQGVACL